MFSDGGFKLNSRPAGAQKMRRPPLLLLLWSAHVAARGVCPANHTIELSFVHARKAGGRSFEGTFRNRSKLAASETFYALSRLPRSLSHEIILPAVGHWTYSGLAQYFSCQLEPGGLATNCRARVSRKSSSSCVVQTTMLRHPIRRFVSAFYVTVGRAPTRRKMNQPHFLCEKNSVAEQMLRNPNSTIEDWVRLDERQRRKCRVDNHLVRMLASDVDRRKQLNVAKRRLLDMPWFGILEMLPASFHLFRASLQTDLIRTTPVFNWNSYNKTLSTYAESVIRAYNALDIELYKFAVEELKRRLESVGGRPPTLECDKDVVCWALPPWSSNERLTWPVQQTRQMVSKFPDLGQAKEGIICAPRAGCTLEYPSEKAAGTRRRQRGNEV
eukprot:scaffold7066_cov253-Pinguiococcus_pyrenoidosus.AAC.19